MQKALQKLNQNLDGLQVTLTRANDLLNDRNRANIAGSLEQSQHLVAEARPKATESLDNLNGMLTDARPKVSASLTNVQAADDETRAAAGRPQDHHRARQRHAVPRGCDADGEPRRTFARR